MSLCLKILLFSAELLQRESFQSFQAILLRHAAIKGRPILYLDLRMHATECLRFSLLQVQTLQATRRKEEKQTRDTLTVPVKRQSGLFADVAEVSFSFPVSRARLGLK